MLRLDNKIYIVNCLFMIVQSIQKINYKLGTIVSHINLIFWSRSY